MWPFNIFWTEFDLLSNWSKAMDRHQEEGDDQNSGHHRLGSAKSRIPNIGSKPLDFLDLKTNPPTPSYHSKILRVNWWMARYLPRTWGGKKWFMKSFVQLMVLQKLS